MDINELVDAIQQEQIRITDHADEEAQSDKITYDEISSSVLQGEIIEEYPKDKPYPSCLVFGKTFSGEAIHSVWAYNKISNWAVLITVYRPDPSLWIDFKVRRKKS